MALVAMNAEMRVRTLIALTEELTAIFAQENAAITAGRPEDAAPLRDDKFRLAAAYQDSIRRIAADRAVLDGASEPLLEKLRATTSAFERHVVEQHNLMSGVPAAPTPRHLPGA